MIDIKHGTRFGKSIIYDIGDGQYMLSRPNPEVEKYLDEHLVRIAGKLIWVKPMKPTHLYDLQKLLDVGSINIVGKGPSLDNLKPLAGVTIAINEAVKFVEADTLLGMQQDVDLGMLSEGEMIVSRYAADTHYKDRACYIYSPEQLGSTYSAPTVVNLIKLLRFLDVKPKLYFYCFDAYTTGNKGYAQHIFNFSNKDPNRFDSINAKLIKELEGFDYEFIASQ